MSCHTSWLDAWLNFHDGSAVKIIIFISVLDKLMDKIVEIAWQINGHKDQKISQNRYRSDIESEL